MRGLYAVQLHMHFIACTYNWHTWALQCETAKVNRRKWPLEVSVILGLISTNRVYRLLLESLFFLRLSSEVQSTRL